MKKSLIILLSCIVTALHSSDQNTRPQFMSRRFERPTEEQYRDRAQQRHENQLYDEEFKEDAEDFGRVRKCAGVLQRLKEANPMPFILAIRRYATRQQAVVGFPDVCKGTLEQQPAEHDDVDTVSDTLDFKSLQVHDDPRNSLGQCINPVMLNVETQAWMQMATTSDFAEHSSEFVRLIQNAIESDVISGHDHEAQTVLGKRGIFGVFCLYRLRSLQNQAVIIVDENLHTGLITLPHDCVEQIKNYVTAFPEQQPYLYQIWDQFKARLSLMELPTVSRAESLDILPHVSSDEDIV